MRKTQAFAQFTKNIYHCAGFNTGTIGLEGVFARWGVTAVVSTVISTVITTITTVASVSLVLLVPFGLGLELGAEKISLRGGASTHAHTSIHHELLILGV